MQTGYLYNNEAIATVAIGQFMKLHRTIDVAKIMLVLPFILHDSSVRALRSNSNKRSLEEYIVQNPNSIVGFNNRYLDLIPISINAITILKESNIIRIQNGMLSYNNSTIFNPESIVKIGTRAKYLFPAIESLSELMKTADTNSFYLKLKIQL